MNQYRYRIAKAWQGRSLMTCWAVLLAGMLVPAESWAELAVDLTYNRTPIVGRQKPCIVLTSSQRIRSGVARVEREGRQRRFRFSLAPGQRKRLCWREAAGRYQYNVDLSAGAETKRVRIAIDYLPALRLDIDKSQIDLEGRRLVFSLNQPAKRAELQIRAQDGAVLSRKSESFSKAVAGAALQLRWKPLRRPIARLDLRVYSVTGRWISSAVTLWSMQIPHREVIFETDKWDLRRSETPKLDDAIRQIRQALKKRGSGGLPVKLYIAGFTDTVGSRDHNRVLSEKRARAIAAYFRRHGVSLPTYYRGYGEEALSVKTADETDESRNRRALYILANQAPVISRHVQWGQWIRSP